MNEAISIADMLKRVRFTDIASKQFMYCLVVMSGSIDACVLKDFEVGLKYVPRSWLKLFLHFSILEFILRTGDGQ